MGGTIAATCNVLATMFSSGPVDSAFSFFLSAIVVLVIATVGYILLPFTVSVAFIHRSRFIILCEFCAIHFVSIIGIAVCALSCLRSPPQALPLLDGTLVHHRCLPNNVAAHFQLSILGHIGANGIA